MVAIVVERPSSTGDGARTTLRNYHPLHCPQAHGRFASIKLVAPGQLLPRKFCYCNAAITLRKAHVLLVHITYPGPLHYTTLLHGFYQASHYSVSSLLRRLLRFALAYTWSSLTPKGYLERNSCSVNYLEGDGITNRAEALGSHLKGLVHYIIDSIGPECEATTDETFVGGSRFGVVYPSTNVCIVET